MANRTNLTTLWVISVFLLVLAVSTTAAGRTIYVDADAGGANNGSSWTDAYRYLQNGLAAASSGDEIRVAQGVYKPAGAAPPPPPPPPPPPMGSSSSQDAEVTALDRTATFRLKNGVAIYGGFPPGGGTWEERDPNDPNNETILSGDLLGNDGPDFANNGENSYHVVTGSGTDQTTILDGFTITAGNAGTYGSGGGMINNNSSPTVANCTFSDNSAGQSGGGMHNGVVGNPVVTNCTFIGNSAGRYGGGIANYGKYGDCRPTVTNCTFNRNSASYRGGGMHNNYTNITVANCTFSDNSAGQRGGGMYNYSSGSVTNCTFSGNSAEYGGGMDNNQIGLVTNCTFSGNSAEYGGGMHNFSTTSPRVTNCTFSGNSANVGGGGMCNRDWGSPTVTNCTFSGNSAGGGGGMFNYSGKFGNCHPTVTNCILWGNAAPSGPQIYNDETSSVTVSYSDVQGGWPGAGNIVADPCFVAPDSNDFHLLPSSPCIDAGDNTAVPAGVTTDLDGAPRFVDDPYTVDTGNPPGADAIVDMGAYEYRPPIYVDEDAPGPIHDGSGWADAFNHLQDALAVAISGDEIRVAEGVYKPDEDTAHPDGSGARDATFQLINGLAIKGGYAGFGEPNPNERDPNTYETILSGDLNGDDGPDFANNGENSYHVVTGSVTNPNAVLDGFTITAGNANGTAPYDRGGGMYNNPGSPTVTNCIFTGNSAVDEGGGMFNYESSPMLTNCTFTANSAGKGGGMYNYWYSGPTITNCTFSGNSANYSGGGIYNRYYSSPTVTNCTFSGNSADNYYGGGMYNRYYSSPTVTNCTFNNNSAGESGSGMCNRESSSPTVTNCIFSGNRGGGCGGMLNGDNSSPTVTNCTFSGNRSNGMRNSKSSPTVTNCTFTGNSANLGGGGMSNKNDSSPTITNCTFSGNSAVRGGGMYNQNSSSTLTNCILWGNTAPSGPQIFNDWTSSASVSYTDVQGGWPGTGNKNDDPLFIDASNGDLRLLPDSPCIDAGDNTQVPPDTLDLDGDGDTVEPTPWDLDGRPRFIDDPCTADSGNGTAPIVDMGAYEANYIEVSMKFTPQALNPGSKGNWVKAHFVLPDGFDVNDVDANTPALIQPGSIESDHMDVFINEDGLVEIEAAFSRSDFCALATSDDGTEVIVIGLLNSGQNFYGTDTIKIITHNLKYVAVLAAHWLEADCGAPDWCGGVDLDHNSMVDLVDFALFDGCCIEVIRQ